MERVVVFLVAAVILYDGSARGQVGRNETVLNPNLAAVEELLDLAQLDSALVEGIEARRPFPGMAAFDAYLDSTPLRTRCGPNSTSTSFCPSTSTAPAMTR